MQKYCAEDVLKLPRLLCVYAGLIRPHLAHQVAGEALRRVQLSQRPEYNPHGRQKAIGPSMNWQRYWNPTCLSHMSGLTFARTTFSPALVFPMSLVCSAELAEYCLIDQTAPERPLVPVTKATALPEAVTPAQPVTPDEIAQLTQQLGKADIGPGPRVGSQLPEEENEDDNESSPGSDGPDYSLTISIGHQEASYNGSEKDFTACSGDDCGWCGHCDY